MNIVRILSRRAGRLATFLTVVALVVLLDQATKAAVCLDAPVGTPPRTLIPGVLDLYHVENTGAAFSLGQGATPLFVALALVVIIAALVWVAREQLPLFLVVSIACVAGGGAGNMVDRLTNGSVTDFLATTFISFPVFNVADIFVTLGVIATFLGYLWWEKRQEETVEVIAAAEEDIADLGISSDPERNHV